MKTLILLKNNLIDLKKSSSNFSFKDNHALVTVISNLNSFGYMPSKEVIDVLSTYNDFELEDFWIAIKSDLNELTGNDRNMEDFVVYKNFPSEVLNKNEVEYWIPQILMYLGIDNEFFTEDVAEREPLIEERALKIIHLSKNINSDLSAILNNLLMSKSNWSEDEFEIASYLSSCLSPNLDISDFGSKENAINLFVFLYNSDSKFNFNIPDATDVLRFASVLSGQDISLRDYSFERNFKRSERKLLLNFLENSKNLIDDISMRKKEWKTFFQKLKVGDYKNSYPKCMDALNLLYNKKIKSFDAKIQSSIDQLSFNSSKISESICLDKKENLPVGNLAFKEALENLTVLSGEDRLGDELKESYNRLKVVLFNLLKTRPGVFINRFHKVYSIDSQLSVNSFLDIADKIDNLNLLKFKRYLTTINDRKKLIYTPSGNWSRSIIANNIKPEIIAIDVSAIIKKIDSIIKNRVSKQLPDGVCLDPKLKDVKIQSNGQDISQYGRGTKIDIPDNITFIRSGSYWAIGGRHSNTWFDNGWNFFDDNWKSLGACCWDRPSLNLGEDRPSFNNSAAIFSGDPTNSKDMKGRACQMIDLYLDRLRDNGVRYAVWNILAYSKISFDGAEDLLATMQWGEDPLKGKLYEPARAQITHKLQGDNFVKYLIYLDLKENKIVYMDANLRGRVNSASSNANYLSEIMPSYCEYMDTIPSVHDLFENNQDGDIPVVFSDKNIQIKGKALVVNPENEDNEIESISIEDILNS